jgi:hypothetical protein
MLLRRLTGTGIDAEMEGGKSGDAVGGVRRVNTPGQPISQCLLAHSDVDRCYSYEFCDPVPFPVHDYRDRAKIGRSIRGLTAGGEAGCIQARLVAQGMAGLGNPPAVRDGRDR